MKNFAYLGKVINYFTEKTDRKAEATSKVRLKGLKGGECGIITYAFLYTHICKL